MFRAERSDAGQGERASREVRRRAERPDAEPRGQTQGRGRGQAERSDAEPRGQTQGRGRGQAERSDAGQGERASREGARLIGTMRTECEPMQGECEP